MISWVTTRSSIRRQHQTLVDSFFGGGGGGGGISLLDFPQALGIL